MSSRICLRFTSAFLIDWQVPLIWAGVRSVRKLEIGFDWLLRLNLRMPIVEVT